MLRRQFRSACEDFRERRLLYRTCEQLTRIALSLRDRLWRNESQRFHLIGVGLSNLSEAKQPNAPRSRWSAGCRQLGCSWVRFWSVPAAGAPPDPRPLTVGKRLPVAGKNGPGFPSHFFVLAPNFEPLPNCRQTVRMTVKHDEIPRPRSPCSSMRLGDSICLSIMALRVQ